MTTTVLTFLIFFIAILSISSAAETPKWNYEKGDNGPMNWKARFTDCKNKKQSPIDIIVKQTKYQKIPDFKLNKEYYKNDLSQYNLINNGHTITISINAGVADKVIEEGGLKNKYKLVQFHMHWDVNDGEGSEHAIDNHNSSMELHLVHMNIDKFTDFSKAAKAEEGLAVLGVMIEVGKLPHPGFQKIVDVLNKVMYKDMKTPLDANFSITELLPCSTDRFFRYQGSLTTPPCTESVVWTIFKEPVKISHEQMVTFRSLFFNAKGETEKKMVGNHRPLQPLENREVLRTYLIEEDLNSTVSLTISILVMILLEFFSLYML